MMRLSSREREEWMCMRKERADDKNGEGSEERKAEKLGE